MPNRATKFASAIFAGLLAGTALTTTSHSPARAADDCLSGPKDETPEGRHWYYRIDHATKRHCWYLREQGEKPLQIAAPNLLPSVKPVAPRPEASTQRSIANARAELPAQTRIDQDNSVIAGQQPAAAAATAAGMENSQRTNAAVANTRPSVIASRWPDQSGANPSTDPGPDAGNPATPVNPPPGTQAPSVVATGHYAAADLPPKTSGYSRPARLALMGALALAGIVGSVVFKLSGARRPRPANILERRGPVWALADDDNNVRSVYRRADALPRRSGFARDLDEARRNDRIAEFFSQLSRRAPT